MTQHQDVTTFESGGVHEARPRPGAHELARPRTTTPRTRRDVAAAIRPPRGGSRQTAPTGPATLADTLVLLGTRLQDGADVLDQGHGVRAVDAMISLLLTAAERAGTDTGLSPLGPQDKAVTRLRLLARLAERTAGSDIGLSCETRIELAGLVNHL